MHWLEARLRELKPKGKSGAGLAEAIGRPKQRVYEMYRQNGKQGRFLPHEIGRAAHYLEWTETELLARIEGGPMRQPTRVSEKMSIFSNDKPTVPLLLYRVVPATAGERSGYMLQRKNIGEIDRPRGLELSKKAFAIKLLDGSCEPVYRFLDILYVDPEDPLITDEDCLFTSDEDGPAGGFCIIARLVSSTDATWTVRLFGASEDSTLSRNELRFAWPILGKLRRR